MSVAFDANVFCEQFDAIAELIHATARAKGWYDNPPSDMDRLCLIHSEVSEACEAIRHHNPPDDKIPQFSGAEAELADVLIRVLDYAAYRKWDLPGAIVAKMAFNNTREYRHSGKAC